MSVVRGVWSVAGTTTLDRECHFIYSKGNNSDKEYNKDFFLLKMNM